MRIRIIICFSAVRMSQKLNFTYKQLVWPDEIFFLFYFFYVSILRSPSLDSQSSGPRAPPPVRRLGHGTDWNRGEPELRQLLFSCPCPEPASSRGGPPLKENRTLYLRALDTGPTLNSVQWWHFNMKVTSNKSPTVYEQPTLNCMLEKGRVLLPSGLAPRNTSAKFLLGMHGRELM